MQKKQKKDTETVIENVSFTVDAGIISRLGMELVGRAETAVSELVKNAYDADATEVELSFIDTDVAGGELRILDNGHGMNRKQLINGFMRLSSSDKLHNPISPRYNRVRAGRKGIGRFATQRLGSKLTIITKTEGAEKGLRLDVNWRKYEIDHELSSIQNPISEIFVDFDYGTQLIISELRDPWSELPIKRVFRYISELLQPTFLSDRGDQLNIAKKDTKGFFNTRFYKITNNEKYIIADVDSMVFDHALAVIEGHILKSDGICNVLSKRFKVNDSIRVQGKFPLLNNVYFKVYYFIYNYDWYEGLIPKMEYKKIEDFGANNGGIKLYRNGFRVLPYGERGNDWINIDKSSVKTSEHAYVPFNNPNFFGFVEVIDKDGKVFEETSSREGLIENEAFTQLTDFVNKALRQATQRVNSARLKWKKKATKSSSKAKRSTSTSSKRRTTIEKLKSLKDKDEDNNEIIEEAIQKLEEAEMLRVLAGIGLNIAEFTHEIRQFIPSFNGSINFLLTQSLSQDAKQSLVNLQDNFNRFKSYTTYIDHTITQNSNREKKPIDLRESIRTFHGIILNDLQSEDILFEEDYYGYDLFTCLMHPSEWISILYNLYTNAKKAIKRADPVQKKIQLICGKEDGYVYVEFMDNGDGVPQENEERIFDAFFTTSTPPSIDASRNETITGTGLGLKIVRDIISAYQGDIFLAPAENGYSTNFRVEVPEASQEQLESYGY